MVNEGLVYLQSRRQPRQEGDQGFAMRFTSGKVAQHKGVVRKQSFYLSGAAIKKASSARLFARVGGLWRLRTSCSPQQKSVSRARARLRDVACYVSTPWFVPFGTHLCWNSFSLRGFVYVAPDLVASLLVNIGQVVLLAAMLLGIAQDLIGTGAASLPGTFFVARIRAAEMIISVFSGGWLARFSIYILAGTCAVLLRICRSSLLPGIGAMRLVGIGHWSPPSKSILRRIQSWMG